MISAKFHDDVFYTTGYYGKIGGLEVKELNALEIEMLKVLDFKLFVNEMDVKESEIQMIDFVCAVMDQVQDGNRLLEMKALVNVLFCMGYVDVMSESDEESDGSCSSMVTDELRENVDDFGNEKNVKRKRNLDVFASFDSDSCVET
eukprot:CAMPEP_0182449136 /NCGR_PEP_ID=MMETSP1172-20130603/32034_1 /TAXON_ID=708627 /ORGANISM="Timspurckia oligopyrenoides, Strain CCMP3278" /LENGTH=145 /DNA_ID=CAMNT_0024646273 /DNA_START=354 /DNA_END=791 /DNA_ORIENTATION=+